MEYDILFRRLTRMRPVVEMEIVLQDLFLLDEKMNDVLPPEERLLFLTTALLRRRFFHSPAHAEEMADLFIRIRELYKIHTIRDLNVLVQKYFLYRTAQGLTGGSEQ